MKSLFHNGDSLEPPKSLRSVESLDNGPGHTKNSTRGEFTICSEFTTRSDSLLKM